MRTFLLASAATAFALPAVAQTPAPPLRPDVAGPEQPVPDVPRNQGANAYAELRGVADLDSIGDNFRTYAQFTLGGDLYVRRRTIEAGVSGNLNYRLPITGSGRDRFSVNGIGRATFEAIEDTLFIDGSVYGGLVNRTFQGGLVFDPSQTSDNLAQTYSVSVAPRFQKQIGDLLQANASYKVYYINVDESVGGTSGGGGNASPIGQTYSDSHGQVAQASFGTIPGTTRLSVNLLGSGTWDNQEQLEQEYRAYSGSADLGFAVNPRVTLVGSAGYEYYESTQQSIVYDFSYLTSDDQGFVPLGAANSPDIFIRAIEGLDPPGGSVIQLNSYAVPDLDLIYPGPPGFLLNGFSSGQIVPGFDNPQNLVLAGGQLVPVDFGPLINPRTGLFIPDPSGPRQTLYQNDGLVWNAGFRYNPNSRFSSELRVGQRFGDFTVTGLLSWRVRPGLTVSGRITDGLQTYGTLLTQVIDGVPITYASASGRRNGNIGGCVLGPDPGDPTGCIDAQTQFITSGVFRNRYASIGFDTGNRSRRLSSRFSFTQRDYLDTNATTGVGAPPLDPTIEDRRDRSYRLDTSYTQGIGPGQEVSGGIILGYYDRQLQLGGSDFYVTGVGRYYGRISEKLSVVGSIAVTQRWGDDDTTNATLTGGLRYEF